MWLKAFRINNTLGLQLFQLGRFAALFTSSVFIARIIDDKEVIGIYETLLLIGSSTTFFWVSGIINPFIPYDKNQPEEKKKQTTAQAFYLLSCISFLVTIISLLVVFFIQPASTELYYIFLIGNFFGAISFINEYILLLHDRTKSLVLYGILTFLIQTISVSVPLLTDSSMWSSVLALSAFQLVRFIYTLMLLKTYSEFRISNSEFRFLFMKCLPYIGSLLVGGSMAFTDSYFIKLF